MTGKITAAQIEEFIKKQKSDFLADYKRIVEIPSVSADPQYKPQFDTLVKVASDYLRSAGAEVTVFKTKGNPVIFGHIENKKGAPTVAIYNHLDVQPAAKGKDGWTRDPFTFVEENGRFYSRGATDDKGPAMTALWSAKIARELKIPLNFEFIWESEEEVGSPNFEAFVLDAQSHIKADSIVISDTIWIEAGKPTIDVGLRGLLSIFLRLRTGEKDVHSGLCGGAARNPITELCDVITQTMDARSGEIKIPGFEKTWKRISKEEIADFVRAGFTVESFKKAYGLTKLRTEKVEEVVERVWAQPTFEIHGIEGGYQGAGTKTVIPPFAEAKVSFRLVPWQNPVEIFDLYKKFVKQVNSDVEVIYGDSMGPYLVSGDLPERRAVADALEFGFGVRPSFIRAGGSIGAAITMETKLKKPVLFLGLSLPEDSYHGPDESFAWSQLQGGVKAFVKYFELLATLK